MVELASVLSMFLTTSAWPRCCSIMPMLADPASTMVAGAVVGDAALAMS